MENYKLKCENWHRAGPKFNVWKNVIGTGEILFCNDKEYHMSLTDTLNVIETHASLQLIVTNTDGTGILEICKNQKFTQVYPYYKTTTTLSKNRALKASVNKDNTRIAILYENNTFVIYDDYFERLQEHVVNAQHNQVYIEWMHDDYGVAIVTDKTYIFTENYTVRREVDIKSPIAWRGDYNVFAVQKNDRIEFLEPNGLLHGDGFSVNGTATDIFFCSDNHQLIVISKIKDTTYISLHVSSNYHWYLKSEKKLYGKFFGFYNDVIYVENELFMYTLTFTPAFDTFSNVFYVIDGNKLKITDFEKKIIPLPYFDNQIEFDSVITCVTTCHKYLYVISGAYLYIFDHKNYDNAQIIDIAVFISEHHDNQITDISIVFNQLIVRFYTVVRSFELVYDGDILRLDGQAYSFINECKNAAVEDQIMHKLDLIADVDLQTDNLRISACEQNVSTHTFRIEKQSNGYKIAYEDLYITVKAEKILQFDHFIILYTQNSLFVFDTITNEHEKYVIHDKTLQLVSFLISSQQMLFLAQRGNFELLKSKIITKNHIKKMLLAKNYKSAIEEIVSNFIDFSIVTEVEIDFTAFFNSFESKIAFTNCVAQIYKFLDSEKSDKTCADTGDFEFNPTTSHALNADKDYVYTAPTESKICHNTNNNDTDKDITASGIGPSSGSIANNNASLLLKDICHNANVNDADKDTTAPGIGPSSGSIANNNASLLLKDLCSFANKIQERHNHKAKRKHTKNPEFSGEDTFLSLINELKQSEVEMLIIYSKLNDLEKAILHVQNSNINEIKILKNYFAEEEIIKECLGLYDLCFTKQIIEILQKDLYLDFIEAYKNEEEIEKRIMINKLLERKNKVAFYLSQKNDIEGEIKYIKDAGVYEILPYLEMFYNNKQVVDKFLNNNKKVLDKFLNIKDEVLERQRHEQGFYITLFADHVYKTDKRGSIEHYLSGRKYNKAFEIACQLEDYDTASKINKKYIKDLQLYQKCIEGYLKQAKYDKIAEIYENDLLNKTKAYEYYLIGHNYVKCYEINYEKFDNEKNGYLQDDISRVVQNINYIKENIKRFDSILERKKSAGDETLTETTFTSQRSRKSTKSKLRNKIGSRYEKEYVLDQINQTLAKIMHINQAWIAMSAFMLGNCYVILQARIKGFYAEIATDYDRVFDYKDNVFDPDRPIIEKIDITILQ